MKNFLIGMFGKYDLEKFNRDFRGEFWGIEACNFRDKKDIEKLAISARRNGFKFGAHFPLREGIYKLRDPLFLALNSDEREEAMKAFEAEVKYVKELGAEYILSHFPKPTILDESLDWSFWRFSDDREWIYQKDYPRELFIDNCETMFKQLSGIGEKYNIQLVLEHDVLNKYLYNTDVLEKLLLKYNNIKMCLDTGRLHLLQKVDSDFNALQFIRRMAPFVYIVHLWNVRVEDNVSGGHYPTLPSLKAEEGWAPIKEYINLICSINPEVNFLFEHRSDLISDEELQGCYNWIDSLQRKANANK